MPNRLLLLLWLAAGCLPARAQAPDAKALRIHRNALTVDTHADIPTIMAEQPGYDIGQPHDARATHTKIDLPRMEQGGMDAMFFVVYVGQGPRTPQGYAAARQEAARLFDLIHAIPKKYPDRAGLATTPADARRLAKAGKRALFIGMENGWPVGKDLSMLQTYYDLGTRYITLTHFLNNDIGDSATDPAGPEHNGLSPFGEQVVAEMNRLGIGADLDGGGGVRGMFDVSEMGNVTRELLKRGYSTRDIEKIWSGNLFRVMRAVERVH